VIAPPGAAGRHAQASTTLNRSTDSPTDTHARLRAVLHSSAAQVNRSAQPLTSRFLIPCCPSGSAELRPQRGPPRR
jgi:hypothetical protein